MKTGRPLSVAMGALLLATVMSTQASAQEVNRVSDLISEPQAYQGRTVTVQGELVGDYGFRRNGEMWTQLNDDPYAEEPLIEGRQLAGVNVGIGVRMPHELAADLDPPGGYRLRGPIVRVTGVYRYHDPGRQGETFVDVQELTVVDPGQRIEEGANPAAVVGGLLLLAAAGGMLLANRRRREQT